MSGVYIPDTEKPKCCFLCPLCYEIPTLRNGYCRLLFEENEAVEGGQMWRTISDVTELADFCPLVAVPDHGRLIDESKVLDIVFEWCPDDDGSVGKYGDLREMLDEIEALPAVIEAEEGE